jgi:ureidoglycolate lyase
MLHELIPEALNQEAFRPFGTYAELLTPFGEKLGAPPVEFFHDLLQQDMGACSTVSFSTCRIEPRQFVIDTLEHHSHTAETMMPLDNDVLVQLAPATPAGAEPELAKLRVFRVPKGTMFLLRPGVWHHGPFVVNDRPANLLVALPERTYANDTSTVTFPSEEQLRINPDPISKPS